MKLPYRLLLAEVLIRDLRVIYNQYAILLYVEVFVISRMKRMDSESVISRS